MNTLGLLRPWRRLSLGRAVSPKAPGLWGTGPGPLRMTQHEAGPENCEPLSGALWTCRCLHPGRDDSVLKLPRALGVAILCVHRGGDRGSEEIWPHCGGDQVQAQPLIPVHRSVLPARVLEVRLRERCPGSPSGVGQGAEGARKKQLEDRRLCFLHTAGPGRPQLQTQHPSPSLCPGASRAPPLTLHRARVSAPHGWAAPGLCLRTCTPLIP